VYSKNELGHVANRTHYDNYVTINDTYVIKGRQLNTLAYIPVLIPTVNENESVTITLINADSD
jgi:hypothetical protein